MQISTSTVSHRLIHKTTKDIVKNVISDINGTPNFVLVALTSSYKNREDYQKALLKIQEESGTENIMGGTFPAVVTSDEKPTVQGCAAMAIKSNEIHFEKPFAYSNIRTKPKKGAKIIKEKYKNTLLKSKIGFIITPGPSFLPGAMEDMKPMDSFFAHKFKRIFGVIGTLIQKNMGKQGYGVTEYADVILEILSNSGVDELIGGATYEMDVNPNFQFQGNQVYQNALVGTVISSDILEFGHSWTFDKSQKHKSYIVTDYLKGGYIQKIEKKSASDKFLDEINTTRELYDEAFSRYSYASLLYLTAVLLENGEYSPYVCASHPALKGLITSIPNSKLNGKPFKTELFTQSGSGIKKSAYECAIKARENIDNPLFGIFVNCSNRLIIAGDKIEDENIMIKKALGEDVPFITLYGGGEFSLINSQPIYSSVSLHSFIAGKASFSKKNVVF